MLSQEQKLALMVQATNEANAVANALAASLRDAFRAFVGKKIFKNDGNLLNAVVLKLPDCDSLAKACLETMCPPSTNKINVYRSRAEFSLWWKVDLDIQLLGHWMRATSIANVGEVDSGVLREIVNLPDLRTDYTVQEVIDKRSAVHDTRRAYESAKSLLYPFCEFYN